MEKTFTRLLDIALPKGKSAFLWGPRKTGKTFWINTHLKDFILIDFLKTDTFAEYISRPHLLRERYMDCKKLIVIDEVQMVPDILNEVHWLIENHSVSFLLTGSSPRKLRQSHANLLGGRAWRYTMTPLCYPEIKQLDIEKAILSGLLPSHYNSDNPIMELRSYIADYLKEEIVSWSITQNIPAFSEFLRVTALTNGEILNYTNISRESGVTTKAVRQYFQILEDTLLGFRLQPWRRTNNRRLVETEKFYLFDIGVANYLARRAPKKGTPEFGKAFEHYILMELKAYQSYKNPELDLSYWRTSNGIEVDFILGDMEVAIEVKTGNKVHDKDLKPLTILQSEQKTKRNIIISFEKERRTMKNSIEHLHWRDFLEQLWDGKII
jgi:predicted AAA+ superfamily ATPase